MSATEVQVLREGAIFIIRSVKTPRRHDLVYPATCLADDGDHIVMSATRILPDRDIGPVVFEKGDLFEEHYWRSRWFGVLQISSPEKQLKGWYGNISRPAEIHGNELHSHDLDLDLWIPANGGAFMRLDEDEFAASGLAGAGEPGDPLAAGHPGSPRHDRRGPRLYRGA